MMAKIPSERYQIPIEVAGALEQFKIGASPLAQPATTPVPPSPIKEAGGVFQFGDEVADRVVARSASPSKNGWEGWLWIWVAGGATVTLVIVLLVLRLILR
jgi:hypothetical protein